MARDCGAVCDAAQCVGIIDLGAGTGRFATLFARSFEMPVIGIEPSKGMLAAAAREERPGNLAYVAGAAECLPLKDSSCGLTWLSHVWHHVRDHHACAQELRRVLGRGSTVLVRGTFGDKLDGFPTLFRYWPAAREICRQLPAIRETVLVFEANGFVLTEQRQDSSKRPAAVFASLPIGQNCGLIRLLRSFLDAEFRNGQSALEQAAAHERDLSPVIEVIELLVFQSAA